MDRKGLARWFDRKGWSDLLIGTPSSMMKNE